MYCFFVLAKPNKDSKTQNQDLAQPMTDLATTTWHVVALKQSLRKRKQRNNRSRWHVVFSKSWFHCFIS